MPPSAESDLRVFVSYSSKNQDYFHRVCAGLARAGVRPWSMKDLAPREEGFTATIQTYIRHSHVFLPILTEESHTNGWVHQEIGYAVAMRIPYVPLCIGGGVPRGMIELAQAVVVDESTSSLEDEVASIRFRQRVDESGRHQNQRSIPSWTADQPEERAELIEQYANEAAQIMELGLVRTRGGRGSFSIPDADVDLPVWKARYGDKPRSHGACDKFRRERVALEVHARAKGVRMIVNHGAKLDDYGPGVERTRLCILLQSIQSLELPDEKVQVVLVDSDEQRLMLAVGDWFVAESRSPQPVRGVLQTVFTQHAPTVRRRIAEFDKRFCDLLAAQGLTAQTSRGAAVQQLRDRIDGLERHPAWSCR